MPLHDDTLGAQSNAKNLSTTEDHNSAKTRAAESHGALGLGEAAWLNPSSNNDDFSAQLEEWRTSSNQPLPTSHFGLGSQHLAPLCSAATPNCTSSCIHLPLVAAGTPGIVRLHPSANGLGRFCAPSTLESVAHLRLT